MCLDLPCARGHCPITFTSSTWVMSSEAGVENPHSRKQKGVCKAPFVLKVKSLKREDDKGFWNDRNLLSVQNLLISKGRKEGRGRDLPEEMCISCGMLVKSYREHWSKYEEGSKQWGKATYSFFPWSPTLLALSQIKSIFCHSWEVSAQASPTAQSEAACVQTEQQNPPQVQNPVSAVLLSSAV